MNNSTIKHILVALDASETDKSILLAANTLANKLDAELQALFVEDINLLHLAELPFAREMTYGSKSARQLTLPDMEKQLRAQVERMRRFVESTAQQGKVKVTFNVARGQIESEVCTAAQLTDLLIVGKNTQLFSHSEKLGKVTRGVISGAQCNVLLLQHGAEIGLPVAVMYDGTDAGQRALKMAIQLAKGDHDKLAVFYPANMMEQLQSEVNKLTEQSDIQPLHIALTENTAEAVLTALENCSGRMLLFENSQKKFKPEQMQEIIRHSNKPVILVR